MPRLIRGPLQRVRSRVFDSERWASYAPRSDDIVIATYSKCGTTWMQRIVSMLIFGTTEPRNVWGLSPWPDMRLFGPVEDVLANAEAQTHRRFFKTHMPYGALPVYEGMKFIHVARDGRDAAISLHNHLGNFSAGTRGRLDEISLTDPKFRSPYPAVPRDPAAFFHEWVTNEERESQGDPGASFFRVENSYWDVRSDPSILLVHYADLKKDRGAEMRRVARFLDIDVDEALWPELIESAGFEAMKRQGAELAPATLDLFEGGSDRFFNKGTNGRWQDVFLSADLALYDAKVTREFPRDLADWIERGRLGTGI